SPSPKALSPIWHFLPVELVQRILHELVSIHLQNIGSDPFYHWETLRQLNHHQRRRIGALYRHLLLPILRLGREAEFYPTTNRPEITGIASGSSSLSWVADQGEGEAYDSTNDTITLRLAECESGFEFDTSKGWKRYVDNFPPGGLYLEPQPHYSFTLEFISDLYRWMRGKIPASHLPDVPDDDSDNDSIKVSSSQLIGSLIRAWKQGHIWGDIGKLHMLSLAWSDHCHRLLSVGEGYEHLQTTLGGEGGSEGGGFRGGKRFRMVAPFTSRPP
ncbi:hypothetical protein B0T13DRAFT_516087, partial [Neurospora crassa]